jgi:molybdate-binding protein
MTKSRPTESHAAAIPTEEEPGMAAAQQARTRTSLLAGTAGAMLLLAGGCASVARVTTLSDGACREALAAGFVAALTAQAETRETASRLAREAVDALASVDMEPRPFLVASPSGTDYAFFVERKDDACLLRLYGRQKGFVSYTNNVTYIATQPLAPCRCEE